MAASFLQVTAPVVIVRDGIGAQHYFYAGAVLPSGLDGDHVKQLLDQEMVAEVTVHVDDEGGGPETPTPDAEEQQSAEGLDDPSSEPDSESEPVRPAKKTAAPRRA